MHLRKYFLSSYLCALSLVFCCIKCNDSHFTQQEDQEDKDYYTYNRYKIPRYQSENFLSMIEDTPSNAFIQKLKDRHAKWLVTDSDSVRKPEEIWQNYRNHRAETFPELKNPTIQAFFDSLGKLIKDPAESSNEKAFIDARKKLEADVHAYKIFKDAAAVYTQPERFKLKQATVDCHRYWRFILKRDRTSLDELLDVLESAHDNLKVWQREGHTMGQVLWKKIREDYAYALKDCKYFQYEENKEAIQKSLAFTDQWAKQPYDLNYKELHEVLPHGLDRLYHMLEFLEKKGLQKKDETIKSLQTYCKLIKLQRILSILDPDGCE